MAYKFVSKLQVSGLGDNSSVYRPAMLHKPHTPKVLSLVALSKLPIAGGISPCSPLMHHDRQIGSAVCRLPSLKFSGLWDLCGHCDDCDLYGVVGQLLIAFNQFLMILHDFQIAQIAQIASFTQKLNYCNYRV